MPGSSPSRNAATSSARADGTSPMFQAPRPSTGMVPPDGKLTFFISASFGREHKNSSAGGMPRLCTSKRALMFVIF